MDHHRCNRECRRRGCSRLRKPAPGLPETALATPLFYQDQDQGAPSPYSVTMPQASAMLAAGRGHYIHHKKAFQLHERSPQGPRVPPSDSGNSDASIAVNEMRANVGEPPPEPGSSIASGTVKRAQQKVRAIGRYEIGTTDTKAPLARGWRESSVSLASGV